MHTKWFWTIALGVAGLLANGVALPVFGDLAFRFGNLFALAAAIAFGPLWGGLAALIANLGLVDAGPIHLAILAVLEALAVGWLVRRKLMPITADLLFWLLLGSPCLAIYGFSTSGESAFSVWVQVAHQPINGVMTAVLAEVLLMIWSERIPGPRRLSDGGRRSLRRQLAHWLALATILPILVVGLRAGRDVAETRSADWQRNLNQASSLVAQRLDSHLLRHRQAVEQVTRFFEGERWNDLELLANHLDSVRLTYPNFSTLLVADADGAVRTASPRSGPMGQNWWSVSVADRGYFQRPMTTGEPFISDVFLGRGFGSGAIVAVSAPVRGSQIEPIGVVEGSMDVRIFHDLTRYVSLDRIELVIVDRLDRVLFSTHHARYPPLTDLTDSSLVAALEEGLQADFRYHRGDQEDREGMLAGRADVGLAGWRVVSQVPAHIIEATAEGGYLSVAFGLLAAVLLAAAVASGIAALITRPLEALASVVRGLDADTVSTRLPLVGSTAPLETAELVDGFAAMAVRLEHGYGQLRKTLDEREALNWELEQVLTDLDHRVQARTHELAEERGRAEELQEQYRSLIDGIEAIVWEFDLRENRFSFVSRRAQEILGFDPESWYSEPKLWRSLIPRERRRELVHDLHEAIRRGQSYEVEYEFSTKSGDLRWLRNVMRVLKGEDGRPRTLRGVMVDVTEMRRSQEDQLRRRKLESVGTLAGGIAHDFNNLLTAIFGNLALAELVLEDPDSVLDLREHLDQISRASEKARDLSQKLLTFARGGLPIQKVLRVEDLLREVESHLAGRSRDDLQITVKSDPWPLMADLEQLTQVILELVRNAQQSMPHGGRVDLEVRRSEVEEGTPMRPEGPQLGPGRYVRIEVRDRGVGITAEEMAKVFDPYFTTKEVGRGFGLATAYSIIEHHGGHIEVRSKVGEGTSVCVWLPAADEAEAAAALPAPAPAVKPGRVLVMDDEEAVRHVAKMMLRHLGWSVEAAADGRAAIAAYRQASEDGRPFDLVISDLTVPDGMGGAEAIRRLREVDPEVRAIVCSGYSNDPVMARYREHGFVGVMAKPFGLRRLRRVLDEALNTEPPPWNPKPGEPKASGGAPGGDSPPPSSTVASF